MDAYALPSTNAEGQGMEQKSINPSFRGIALPLQIQSIRAPKKQMDTPGLQPLVDSSQR